MTQEDTAKAESKAREKPSWMKPLNDLKLMPADLQANDMTAGEKLEIWKKRLYAKAAQRSATAAELLISGRKRADETHRKIVAGGVLEAESVENKQFGLLAIDALKRRVEPEARFLFPRLFPDAKRPVRGTKAGTEATA